MLDIIDKLTSFNFVYTMVRNRGITVFFFEAGVTKYSNGEFTKHWRNHGQIVSLTLQMFLLNLNPKSKGYWSYALTLKPQQLPGLNI